MKKRIIFCSIIIIIIVAISIFLFIYNKDSNKLKRYLKKEGYKCNTSICSKTENDIVYQINYKMGTYYYEDQEISITIEKNSTIVDTSKGSSPKICEYKKDGVNDLTTFTEDDTSNNCTKFLEKVNKRVEDFQRIIVKAGVNISKLSK